MTTAVSARRAGRPSEVMLDTLRRFVRRGSRTSIAKLLGKVRPEDVALLMRRLTPAERHEIFSVLIVDYPDSAGDVLTELDPPTRTELLERLSPEEIARILERMEVDDAVFVVESLPSELEERVLSIVDLRSLDDVQSHLAYEEDSAGRIMTTVFFALPASAKVSEAIARVQQERDIEMIFYLYVVDDQGRLAGVTSLRQLLLTSPDKTLGEIAQREVIAVHVETDQEEVARLAARYDLLAIPVLDDDDRLAGIVTVDDIIDIVKEEATEDLYKLAGTSEDELIYQERPFQVARLRLPWLLVNLIGLALTGLLLERFQAGLAEALFLLSFVPVVMGLAGSSGTQASMITVRGLATGRIGGAEGRVAHFLWQQVKSGAFLGLVLGALAALIALALPEGLATDTGLGNVTLYFPLVVGVSVFWAIVLASVNGVLIPVVFQRLGIDPAVASGPLVTASNDVLGILIYFSMAWSLLGLLVR